MSSSSFVKSIFFTCPFVPAEWISAHGFVPVKHIPSGLHEPTRLTAGQGICAYSGAFIEESLASPRAEAVIVTSLCDQMRRACEHVEGKPLFCLNLPATWQTAAAKRLYLSELERLGRFLVDLGGRTPSAERIARSAREMDGRRRELRSQQGRLSARAFAEAVNTVHDYEMAKLNIASSGETPVRSGDVERGETEPIPIAIAGGPLPTSMYGLYDLIENEGGRVALDATENCEIALAPRLDALRLEREPFEAMASAYFDCIPGAFRRPNTLLYDWLDRALPGRKIRALLFVSHTWCDLWQAEAVRMKERFGLPFLSIRLVREAGFQERVRSQVQAFLEVLR